MAEEQHSLPLAPPSALAHSAAQTPLSNADFRKLLSTPRPGRAVVRAGAEADQRGGAPREKKPFRPKAKPAAAEEGGDGLTYRDRAAERRDNANPDYEGLAGSLGATRAFSSGVALGVPVAVAMTVEETRYLGGDLEHTHLVKGLDYALLHKARQAARLEEAGERVEEARPGSDVAAPPPTVHTSLGRAIHAFITGQHRHASAAVERFAQGRVAFLFDLELNASGSELPSTLLRVRATDDADAADAVLCAPDAPLLLRAGEAFGRLRCADTSLTGKKLRRKEKALEPPVSHAPKARAAMACAAADDDEEDIFADAGRAYVCEPSKPQPAERAFVVAPGPYFGVAVPQPLVAAEVPAPAAKAQKPAPAAAAERLRKLQELDADSAYGELYPGDGGYGFNLAGSDDEGGAGDGASKPKTKGAPKDGSKARDAKLSSQLQDVRRALAEKHGEKFEGAFAKRSAEEPPVDDAVGAAKARAKRLRL